MVQVKTQTQTDNIIGLDVGDKKVGIAMTSTLAKLPSPFITLVRDDTFWTRLEQLIVENMVTKVVVGLPRNLSGDNTMQTYATKEFITEFNKRIGIEVTTQDEALTSRQAEQELRARGKVFTKGDIDALAATYILEDYLDTLGATDL